MKSTFFPLLDCTVIRVLPPSPEEIKVAKDQEKEEKILGKRKKRFFPPYNVFKYELQQLDSDNHDLKIVEANDIRREPGIYMRRKNLLFLKNMMEFDKKGGSYYRVLKSVREKYDLDGMPFDEIFSGPEPEFETDIKTPENALFSDEEDDSDDSTIANSKNPKEEFMEIPLEKGRDMLPKLIKIWLHLIEFLNQENLWSRDVTENMFLCINRICCLIERRKCKPDYYLDTYYYLEPKYVAFNLCKKFGKMSLIKIIINPAYSANFMICTSHEHIRDAKESHGTFLWQVTCKNFHE